MKLNNILIACLLTVSAGAVMAQRAEYTQVDNSPNTQALTRAEVLADLTIYRESGLLDLERGNRLEIDTPAYTAAAKRYQELRNSSVYAQLVRSYASKTGEKVAAAKLPGGTASQQ